jgi:hypothetical protein
MFDSSFEVTSSEEEWLYCKRFDRSWTLEEGIKFARKLELDLAPLGYHCAITGSVLYKGRSEKDLDIMIYPHDSTKCNEKTQQEVEKMLDKIHGIQIELIDRMKYPDEKNVYWSYDTSGKRIDFFFVK